MTRVVVVGRDAPLWLTALALTRALCRSGVTVETVELPTALARAAVYPTLPPLEALHARIGIDEASLLGATGGAFSLGHNFTGAPALPFFHAWGTHGAPVSGEPFFPVWARARNDGLDARLQDFCLTATAASQGRLLLPDDATASFGRTDYGYHLPARAYAGALERLAARLGIATHQTMGVTVERDGATGAIASVALDGGSKVAGDLFVDASGGEAALIGAMGVAREDWRGHFPGDRRLVAIAPGLKQRPPYAEVRAWAGGWLRLHPTRGDTRIEQVYASELIDDDAARAGAAEAAGLPLSDIAIEAIDPGVRATAWHANCVAIGGAACAIDPIHGAELHVAQLGIVHLLGLFPATANFDAERAEYNRITRSAFARIRDFQQAYYALAPWQGAFWDRARGADIPSELAHKIALFRARGEVAPMEDESFSSDSWQAMLVGLGVTPESWPPSVDRLAPEAMRTLFGGMLGFIRDKVAEQPAHDRYLADLTGRAA